MPIIARTTLEPASVRMRSSRSGRIGLLSRASSAMNADSRTTATAPKPSVCADAQPW